MIRTDPSRHPELVRYTRVAQALHWVIVLLLVIQFTLAWTMPDVHRGTKPEGLISLHLSFGLTILLLMAVRLVWRITHKAPPPPTGLPVWQLVSSRVVHSALYLLLIVVPVLGWINASYRGWRIVLFAVLSVPSLVASRVSERPTSLIGPWTGDVHVWLSYGLIGVASVHILGALYHRFILRDRLLARMIPGA